MSEVALCPYPTQEETMNTEPTLRPLHEAPPRVVRAAVLGGLSLQFSAQVAGLNARMDFNSRTFFFSSDYRAVVVLLESWAKVFGEFRDNPDFINNDYDADIYRDTLGDRVFVPDTGFSTEWPTVYENFFENYDEREIREYEGEAGAFYETLHHLAARAEQARHYLLAHYPIACGDSEYEHPYSYKNLCVALEKCTKKLRRVDLPVLPGDLEAEGECDDYEEYVGNNPTRQERRVMREWTEWRKISGDGQYVERATPNHLRLVK